MCKVNICYNIHTNVTEKGNSMILIKDLGQQKLTPMSKRTYGVGLYECGSCGKRFNRRHADVGEYCKICGPMIKNTTHGMFHTKQYRVWAAMIQRTTNKNNKRHDFYKDKKPQKRWFSFELFWEDMKSTYKEGLSLDRIDNSLPYSKDNCRWTTQSVQSQNTRLIRKRNKSGYRGVSIHPNGGFQIDISVDGKGKYLGYRKDAKEAAMIYDKFVEDNNLEHTLNFPKEQ